MEYAGLLVETQEKKDQIADKKYVQLLFLIGVSS
jgi:hypothetical protein